MNEVLFSGFQSRKQEYMYHEFASRALELMQQEILNRRGISEVVDCDEAWERKVCKVHKAM